MKKIYFIIILSAICYLLSAICLKAQDLSEAEIQYLKGDYNQAVQTLEKVLAQDVDKESSVKVYYLLGLSYLKERNYLRAGDCFDIIVKEYADSNFALNSLIKLIDIELLTGNYRKAQESCQSFLNKYPGSNKLSALLLRQYNAYIKLGDTEQAQATLSKLKTAYPDSPELKSSSEKEEVGRENNFSVQVGFFKDRKNAQNFSALLKKKGFDSFIEESFNENNDLFFRVKVGRGKTKEEAILIENKLKQEGYSTKISP